MGRHPDLDAEQAHVDRAYGRIEAMRAIAEESLAAALTEQVTTPQSAVERESRVGASLFRLSQLDIGSQPLCFGRIDRESGESFHLGRLAVADEDHEPLVVDWRAPAAEPFYRATGRHPLGLRRRRHFLTEGRRITEIEDEWFGELSGEDPVGPSVLLTALERSRTGRMQDIVATIQREQDEIIRAPLPGLLVVQGGPGTGKTAVALHRAAYLLYTHRFPLERQGVLVVGPNPLFLRYIEHVLPSLGESGVELSTISGLYWSVSATGTEHPSAARLKGDVRMARVLARAVADRQRRLPRTISVGVGPVVLRVTPEESGRLVAAVRRRGGAHNARRRTLERLLFRHLHERYIAALDRNRRVGLRPESEPRDENQIQLADLTRDLKHRPEIREMLERMWPVLTPEQLVRDLFGAPSLIASATDGLLTPDERVLLHRPRGEHVDDVAWTDADVALLDEARALLGGTGRKHNSNGDHPDDDPGDRTYGHLVVDEAQDLSPMQLRMLARRSLGSATLVGDVAQATGQWAPNGWDDVLAQLPSRREPIRADLTVNYRTPAEIMDVASRVLAVAVPGAEPPESVRSTGQAPSFVQVGAADLAAEVARVTASEALAVDGGNVAIIAAPSLLQSLAAALDNAGVGFEHAARSGLDAPVTLVPVDLVKGLEFDAVVVVEPALIVGEASGGLRALYVALTRATKRMAIVHAGPLPDSLSLT